MFTATLSVIDKKLGHNSDVHQHVTGSTVVSIYNEMINDKKKDLLITTKRGWVSKVIMLKEAMEYI